MLTFEFIFLFGSFFFRDKTFFLLFFVENVFWKKHSFQLSAYFIFPETAHDSQNSICQSVGVLYNTRGVSARLGSLFRY